MGNVRFKTHFCEHRVTVSCDVSHWSLCGVWWEVFKGTVYPIVKLLEKWFHSEMFTGCWRFEKSSTCGLCSYLIILKYVWFVFSPSIGKPNAGGDDWGGILWCRHTPCYQRIFCCLVILTLKTTLDLDMFYLKTASGDTSTLLNLARCDGTTTD